ncbi:MAG TPA: DUF5916 domain-containing protein [Bacteroidales bacterium]|nr:DUF5916 domain-containing protein [Bacteroidales bacterium]
MQLFWKYTFLIFFVFGITGELFSQSPEKKELKALRIAEKPKIDGILNDSCWQQAAVATGFVQHEPLNGAEPTYQSVFKVAYNNNSIFIGALLYDPEPEKIMRELGPRDSDDLNADAILVSFSPYNDGQNSFDFALYASGVQVDAKTFSGGDDISWDAVWKSEARITEQGWVAEVEIPFSALRFPRTDAQTWGFNFVRQIRRIREISHWNFVDKEIDGVLNQAGILRGIENVTPPLRLSLEPYLLTSLLKEPGADSWDYKFNGGMDLKYGINESFTLDMTLIPDFSQVQSDDQVVNLGPFETYYSEKRQFFTEGVELFSRGDVFYSRRIGSQPRGYEIIDTSFAAADIISNPEQTRLINATKVSGRTSKGTGIGIFNAMTAPSYAEVKSADGKTPEIQTQPFTNYSMIVADQSLPNKSYISLYNTNVYMGKNGLTANVTGTEMNFRNRKNWLSASAMANVSQKYFPDDSTALGFTYEWSLEKISGKANYGVWQEVISDTYDPNDLGYLENNNEMEHGGYFSYNIYDPFWKILDMHNSISLEFKHLYAPGVFTGMEMNIENRTQFKNRLTVGLEAEISPAETRDYFEPRNAGWFVQYPASASISTFFSPDYNKTFLVDVMPGISWASDYGQLGYYLRLSPRYKVNPHLFLVLTALYSRSLNDIGYVTDSLENAGLKIIFGRRDIENITTTLTVNYSVNPKFSFSGRLRYYYFKADYKGYYDLGKDGSLSPNGYTGADDFLYSAFNIDAYFTWLFAPGSELVLAWKNAIYTNKDLPAGNYFREFGKTLDSPASNLISLKILYYLDSQYFRKKH